MNTDTTSNIFYTPDSSDGYQVSDADGKVGFFGATPSAQVAIADISGTLTGSANGTIADVDDITLSTSDTYTDAAVNTAVNAAVANVNLQMKEILIKLAELIDELQSKGLIG